MMIQLLLVAVSGLLIIGCATSREKQRKVEVKAMRDQKARFAAQLELYKIQQARAQPIQNTGNEMGNSTSAPPLGSFANPIYIAPTPIKMVPMTQPISSPTP